MLDTSIQVKTDHFDGPLGLLLLLVEKEEMNIRDLDLTKITKQYLDYLAQMRDLNFDVAGDYLFLASTLLLLKSKICIAEEELKGLEAEFGIEGMSITSQSELIRRLEELQLYQKMSKKLWGLEKKGHEVFVKPKVDRKAIVNSFYELVTGKLNNRRPPKVFEANITPKVSNPSNRSSASSSTTSN